MLLLKDCDTIENIDLDGFAHMIDAAAYVLQKFAMKNNLRTYLYGFKGRARRANRAPHSSGWEHAWASHINQ